MSVTILGIVATVLGLVFTPDEANAIVSFIDQAIVVVGILLAYYGRYRQGDITFYGTRK